jgi:coenzyme F420 biosynthesis associated uncharacterized protein
MSKLIEPWIARGVARRLAGRGLLPRSYLMERLARDLATAVPRSEELVSKVSGIPAPPPVSWAVIDRAQWAEANIKGMAELLAPLADKVARRLESVPAPVRMAQRALVSAEVGVLLGYVSRRVLGQYDLLVTKGNAPGAEGGGPTALGGAVTNGRHGAALYFVGPNIVETERTSGFVPEEFALWVALHEVTHRFQFDGVPWLRARFFGLVRSYVEAVDLDARGLAGRLATAASRLKQRSVPPEERNPIYLLASEEQRAVLDDIQALMAVVEGHGNFVMDHIGADVIPSFRRMRGVFDKRRHQVSTIQRAVNHAIGLEMKLRQYELGHAFCRAVTEQGGISALSHLWEDPAHWPSLAELREPERWMRRVA